jgi:hypothetical protein
MNVNGVSTIADRIERALARIEAVVARPAQSAPGQDSARAFAELSARHEALREEAKAALDGLAALITDAKGAD